MRKQISVVDFFRKNWLLVGILFGILLAALNPEFGSKNGPLYTEYTIKYGATGIIFLISGISLKTEHIFETFHQYKIHFFIQCYTFILVPICMQIFVRVLTIFAINTWILKGLIIVGCMPPPVSSAVILTRAANGNETAAIFNSILGSFLGIFITPLLLLLHLGITSTLPLLKTVIQLITTILCPILLGQMLRNITSFKGHNSLLNNISQWTLLFIIYTTFCDTFKEPETHLTILDIFITIFSVLLIQMILMGASYFLAQTFNLRDIIAILFCSTHKSLTLGIPILRIMFEGHSQLSQVNLPLLAYHPTQIILGGLLVAHLKDWVHFHGKKRIPSKTCSVSISKMASPKKPRNFSRNNNNTHVTNQKELK